MIWLHVVAPVYGHMIQSKHPEPPGVPTENSSVPVVDTFTIIQVLFNSPLNKHPKLPDAGLVDGLDMVPDVNSVTSPLPLGSI